MTRLLRKAASTVAVAAALALAACGGNNDNNTEPAVTDVVPASASQSIGRFIDYLMKLVVAAADMLEPVNVSGVTAPVDEVSDPTPLP